MRHRLTGSRALAWADRWRIYLLLAAVALTMSLTAPRFLEPGNLTIILRAASLNAVVAIGFTLVLICGELDLSVGTSLTLGAMLAIGLRPALGWPGSVAAAVAAGMAVGLANGLLVSAARINSFIVTLGTSIVVQGLIYVYSHGESLSVTGADDFALADFLETPIVPLLAPRVMISIGLVALFHLALTFTRAGRNLFLVGGSRETAWVSGISPGRTVTAAFVLSGFTAALGGSLFAASMSSATTDLGSGALMDVIAAVIVGGTAMAGGKGSVLRSAVAVLTFAALFNGFNKWDLGSEVRIFVAGLVLALVVVCEALAARRHERVRGRRAFLMEELDTGERIP
jgi:ribose transport system permease protein